MGIEVKNFFSQIFFGARRGKAAKANGFGFHWPQETFLDRAAGDFKKTCTFVWAATNHASAKPGDS